MKKIAYISYIMTSYKLGKKQSQIFNELKTAYGNDAPTNAIVCNWIRRFARREVQVFRIDHVADAVLQP